MEIVTSQNSRLENESDPLDPTDLQSLLESLKDIHHFLSLTTFVSLRLVILKKERYKINFNRIYIKVCMSLQYHCTQYLCLSPSSLIQSRAQTFWLILFEQSVLTWGLIMSTEEEQVFQCGHLSNTLRPLETDGGVIIVSRLCQFVVSLFLVITSCHYDLWV